MPVLTSCPICGRPTQPPYRPFCSARCAEVDLGRWLTGGYAIPVNEDEEEDDPAASAPDAPARDGPGGG